jgi:hypothetical protein
MEEAMRRTFSITVLAVALVVAGAANADDLHGHDRFLCATGQTTACTADNDCETGPAWAFNVPDFLIIDMAAKTLSTTAASGENRITPLLSTGRDGNLIYAQGFERQRAFSILINETTGHASAAVAAEYKAVSMFAVCTPQKK